MINFNNISFDDNVYNQANKIYELAEMDLQNICENLTPDQAGDFKVFIERLVELKDQITYSDDNWEYLQDYNDTILEGTEFEKKLVMKIFDTVSQSKLRYIIDNNFNEILAFGEENQSDLDQKFLLALVEAVYYLELYPDLMNLFELYLHNGEIDTYKYLAIYIAKFYPHISDASIENLYNAHKKPLNELEILNHPYFEAAITHFAYTFSTDENKEFTFDDVVKLINEKQEMLRKFDRFLTLQDKLGIKNDLGAVASYFQGDEAAIESEIEKFDIELNEEIKAPKTESNISNGIILKIFKHTDTATMVRTLTTTKESMKPTQGFRHIVESSNLTKAETNAVRNFNS